MCVLVGADLLPRVVATNFQSSTRHNTRLTRIARGFGGLVQGERLGRTKVPLRVTCQWRCEEQVLRGAARLFPKTEAAGLGALFG